MDTIYWLAQDNSLAFKEDDRADYFWSQQTTCGINFYLPIPKDTSNHIADRIRTVAIKASFTGYINEITAKFLINDFLWVSLFYVFPKFHKEEMLLPGHPILAGFNSLFDSLAKLFLWPFVLKIPSNIKDSHDFISNIEGYVMPDNAISVTLDINLLIFWYQYFHSKARIAVQNVLNAQLMHIRLHIVCNTFSDLIFGGKLLLCWRPILFSREVLVPWVWSIYTWHNWKNRKHVTL